MERFKQRLSEADDRANDDEEEYPSPYEATYRDGSMKNECWRDEE